MSQSIPIAAATNMLSSIRAKEESYKQGIQKNHAFCKSIASRLMKDTTSANTNNNQHIGTIEEVLLKANQDCNNNGNNNNNDVDIGKTEKIQEFLQEQRERLKVLAKHNIEDDRTVSLFCTSLTSLQQYMITNDSTGDKENTTTTNDTTTTNNNTTTPLTDYQIVFEKIMADEQQKQQPNLIDIQYELMYRDICESLGEPVQTKASHNNGTDDDDDDLVCVGNNNATISLKCPITGMLFDDPVKNKACHHTYSRAGIMNHIQVQQKNHTTSNNHTVRCPVPGCSNNKVTIDQLDIDYEMELKLRHVRRRQQDDTTTTTTNNNNNGTTTTTTNNNSQRATSQKNVNTIIDDDDDGDGDDDEENQAQF